MAREKAYEVLQTTDESLNKYPVKYSFANRQSVVTLLTDAVKMVSNLHSKVKEDASACKTNIDNFGADERNELRKKIAAMEVFEKEVKGKSSHETTKALQEYNERLAEINHALSALKETSKSIFMSIKDLDSTHDKGLKQIHKYLEIINNLPVEAFAITVQEVAVLFAAVFTATTDAHTKTEELAKIHTDALDALSLQ